MRRPLPKALDTTGPGRPSRRSGAPAPRRPVAVLLLACALVLALGAAQAQAAPKGVVGFFGSSGAGAGQFSTPAGMAVNQSNGDLYVVDSGNNRVLKLDKAFVGQ